MARKWLVYWFDPKDDEHPICSENGCEREADRIICYYENDARQGEYSKLSGWCFCPDHSMNDKDLGKRRSGGDGE